LKDEYLSQYHSDEDDHTSLPHKHSDWLQAVSNTDQLPKEQLQNLIFQEMLFFHPEAIHVQWGASSRQANQPGTPEVQPLGAEDVPQSLVPSLSHPGAAQPRGTAPTGACSQTAPPIAHPSPGARGMVQPMSPVQAVPMQMPPPPHGYYPHPLPGVHSQPTPGQPVEPHSHQPCQSPTAFYTPTGFATTYTFPTHPHPAYPPPAMPIGACGFVPPQPGSGYMPAPAGSPQWVQGSPQQPPPQ